MGIKIIAKPCHLLSRSLFVSNSLNGLLVLIIKYYLREIVGNCCFPFTWVLYV